MSSSFPSGWEKLVPIELGLLSCSISIGSWWCRGIGNNASHRDQCDGGETGFCDMSAAVNGNSRKKHAA